MSKRDSRVKNVISLVDTLDYAALQNLLEQTKEKIQQKKKEEVPLSIFSKKLTILESLVKFFVEQKGLTLANTARLLNRNERQLWQTRKNANVKHPKKLSTKSELYVPIEVFSKSKCAPTEALVKYLRDSQGLKFSEIAEILQRNQRTVWITYNRAKKKYDKK